MACVQLCNKMNIIPEEVRIFAAQNDWSGSSKNAEGFFVCVRLCFVQVHEEIMCLVLKYKYSKLFLSAVERKKELYPITK